MSTPITAASEVINLQKTVLQPKVDEYARKVIAKIRDNILAGGTDRGMLFEREDFCPEPYEAFVLQRLEDAGFDCRLRIKGYDDNGQIEGLDISVHWGDNCNVKKFYACLGI